MQQLKQASWIRSPQKIGDCALLFARQFSAAKPVKSATLYISAMGVYVATLGNTRIGDFVLAPGWTSSKTRLQVQRYDVTALLEAQNTLQVLLGRGWRFKNRENYRMDALHEHDTALIAALELCYADGSTELICTDDSWRVGESQVRFANIYDGETFDATYVPQLTDKAQCIPLPKDMLMPMQGEEIREQEQLPALTCFTTPRGETVLDFGQVLTGYVRFRVQGPAGHEVCIRHAEILDKDGNFYTENLRSAKQEVRFICDGEAHTYQPQLTFQGFRYIQLVNWPQAGNPADFVAIVVHSDMQRTGEFSCGDPLVNQLFHNVIWGQKGNFLDVPTDCPQRDERLGWTGDAQVFVRTAALNYNVERFFEKWLADLAADQLENGSVPHVIPNVIGGDGSCAWADATVICPWEIYRIYGNPAILEKQFASMQKWVEYIRANAKGYLWKNGKHFGDWLALDKELGGRDFTNPDILATAFFYYSTSLLVKAGLVLGHDMREYELLRENIGAAFRKAFLTDGQFSDKQATQTACVLALHFGLTDNIAATTAQLVAIVNETGHLTTGFVGAPYLLHALSDNGHASLAYDLLLRREYPSWLYPVTMGATTIWERWNGMYPDGTMNDPGMNSFNHYAYGSVADWLYGTVAGINPDENEPGFAHILLKPIPDARLQYAQASLQTRHGEICSKWAYEPDGKVRYSFTIPAGCRATFFHKEQEIELLAGKHEFCW